MPRAWLACTKSPRLFYLCSGSVTPSRASSTKINEMLTLHVIANGFQRLLDTVILKHRCRRAVQKPIGQEWQANAPFGGCTTECESVLSGKLRTATACAGPSFGISCSSAQLEVGRKKSAHTSPRRDGAIGSIGLGIFDKPEKGSNQGQRDLFADPHGSPVMASLRAAPRRSNVRLEHSPCSISLKN